MEVTKSGENILGEPGGNPPQFELCQRLSGNRLQQRAELSAVGDSEVPKRNVLPKPQSRAGWPGCLFVGLVRSVLFRSPTQDVKICQAAWFKFPRLPTQGCASSALAESLIFASRGHRPAPRTGVTSPSPGSPVRTAGPAGRTPPSRRGPPRPTLPWGKPHSHGP